MGGCVENAMPWDKIGLADYTVWDRAAEILIN
jgi:hypothetical protein